MNEILKFPTQTFWRTQGEIPKTTENVFLVAEKLLKIIDKKTGELTREEEVDLEALKTVFSELSLTNFDFISIMNEAEEEGLISYTEKIISTSVFLTIQQIRNDIVSVQKESTVSVIFSTETEEKISNSNLSQNIKNFLIEIIRKVKE